MSEPITVTFVPPEGSPYPGVRITQNALNEDVYEIEVGETALPPLDSNGIAAMYVTLHQLVQSANHAAATAGPREGEPVQVIPDGVMHGVPRVQPDGA